MFQGTSQSNQVFIAEDVETALFIKEIRIKNTITACHFQVLDFFVYPKYLERTTLNYDFGLVKLDTPIGKTTK